MTRLTVTVVVVFIVIGFVLAASGVLRFRNTPDEAGVTIDKKELKEKTHEAVEKTGEVGSKVLDKTGDTLHRAADGLRGSPNIKQAPTATPAADDEKARPSDDGKNPPGDAAIPSDL